MSFRWPEIKLPGSTKRKPEDSIELRGGARRRTGWGGRRPDERVLRRCDQRPRTFPDGRRVRGQLSQEAGEEHHLKGDARLRRLGGARDVLQGGPVLALRHEGAAR